MNAQGHGGKDRGASSFRIAFLMLVGALAFIIIRDAELGYVFSNEIEGVETSVFDRVSGLVESIFFSAEDEFP